MFVLGSFIRLGALGLLLFLGLLGLLNETNNQDLHESLSLRLQICKIEGLQDAQRQAAVRNQAAVHLGQVDHSLHGDSVLLVIWIEAIVFIFVHITSLAHSLENVPEGEHEGHLDASAHVAADTAGNEGVVWVVCLFLHGTVQQDTRDLEFLSAFQAELH